MPSGVSSVLLPGRKCLWCSKELGPSKRANAKYCTTLHKEYAAQKRRRVEGQQKLVPLEVIDVGKARMGKVYREMLERGFHEMIDTGDRSQAHVAVMMDVSEAAVSRAYKSWLIEEQNKRFADAWVMDPDIAKMLPRDEWAELADLGLAQEGSLRFTELTTVLSDAFWQFENRYFTIGSRQAKFIVKPFHEEILLEFLIAQVFSTRVLVLTPPRHGKSELVIRFVAWLIVMFPNIQVLWVASNTKLAVSMCRKLKATFEHTLAMADELLPPGSRFGDDKCPKWTEDEFTLYTRSDHTLKASTFTAIGSTSTVAGRDADFIGVDDLEEFKTVNTVDQREKSKLKHAEIMERQETHTGVVTIASRQHPDDIPASLMQQTGDRKWRVSVFSAHDEECTLDDDVEEGHDNNGCVLFQEMRPYRELLNIKLETEALGISGRYELRYLQMAVPTDGMVFDVPLIREQCLDRSRILGDTTLPPGVRLVAGMDPATRGMQAAVLWGWTPAVTYLIDMEVTKGAGQLGAVALFGKWHDKYGLTHWVYEDNISKQDFFTRPDVIKLKNELGLTIEVNTTGNNKHDPEVGISSMAPWYHTGRFNLPYGNSDSVRKVKMLLSQLQLWTTDGLSRGATVTDIKMASWFPFVKRLVRWDRADRKATLHLVSDQSYPSVGGNHAPWGVTEYPGGQ